MLFKETACFRPLSTFALQTASTETFKMTKFHFFLLALSVLALDKVSVVQSADECKTNGDCTFLSQHRYCCRGVYSWSKDRSCIYRWCLGDYCSSKSDCNDHSLCCRSNKCVNKGCSGCTNNKECYSGQVCCKKTFPFNQTVCASNCLNQRCNSNDDCAGVDECCRSGKCTNTGCSDTCKSKSECNLDQYCCKKKKNYLGDGCSESCLGKICSTNEDCGARNACCISNKCVDRGCSGCTLNSNCSIGQYCCKKRHWYELNECSDHCIGKSCETNDDCGGPGETCNSEYRCTNVTQTVQHNVNKVKHSSNSLLIPLISVSAVLFLAIVVMVLAVFWFVRYRRTANSAQSRTVPLQNSQNQDTRTQNPQLNTQRSGFDNPLYREPLLQNQPQQTSIGAFQSRYPPSHPPALQGGTQGTPNQGPVIQNPTMHSQQQGNSNQGLHTYPPPCYDYQGNQPVMTLSPSSPPFNEVQHSHNQLHDPVYHTHESQDVGQDAVGKGMDSQQMYPLDTSHQGNEHVHNPPYNPQFQSGYPGNP